MQVTGVTLANATGVRLEFFKAGSTGLLKEDYYTPPPILEPGEVASFLVDNSVEFKLNYNIQTFQGPVAFGGLRAGWVAGDPDKTVTVMGQDGFSTTIDATLQVDRGKAYPTQFIFDISRKRVGGRTQWQISVTQSITYSLTGKAAVLNSKDQDEGSILLGGVRDLGFAGGESWTIELWVRVDSIKPGGDNDSDQTVFGSGNGKEGRTNLHCVFRNGGRLHLDFFNGPSADDPDPIQVNVWTHFALQFEKAFIMGKDPKPDPKDQPGDLRIFRNGVLVAANRVQPVKDNNDLSLGRFRNGRPLLGKVAQVRLWNVAVPASEIMARLYT